MEQEEGKSRTRLFVSKQEERKTKKHPECGKPRRHWWQVWRGREAEEHQLDVDVEQGAPVPDHLPPVVSVPAWLTTPWSFPESISPPTSNNGYGTFFFDFDDTHPAAEFSLTRDSCWPLRQNLYSGFFSGASSATRVDSGPEAFRPFHALTSPESFRALTSGLSTPDYVASNPTSFTKCYELLHTPTGNFQTPIHLVRHRETGTQHIIKQVPVPADQCFPTEAEIMMELDHPNIVKIDAVLFERESGPWPFANIVMDFADAGDVGNFVDSLKERGDSVPPEFIMHFISSMIDALCFLHHGEQYDAETDTVVKVASHPSILHRDIKPLNVFLKWYRDGDETHDDIPGLPRIVLGDFGLAATAESDQTNICGTTGFIAPEMWPIWYSTPDDMSEDLGPPVMSYASDMYAFGCTLYKVITGESGRPPADMTIPLFFSRVFNRSEISDLLRDCLQAQPKDRPRANDIRLLRLSAQYKRELRTWHQGGFSLPADIWPNPWNFENAGKNKKKKEEKKQEENKGPSGEEISGLIADLLTMYSQLQGRSTSLSMVSPGSNLASSFVRKSSQACAAGAEMSDGMFVFEI
jgi:serine/threonine protein kinase